MLIDRMDIRYQGAARGRPRELESALTFRLICHTSSRLLREVVVPRSLSR